MMRRGFASSGVCLGLLCVVLAVGAFAQGPPAPPLQARISIVSVANDPVVRLDVAADKQDAVALLNAVAEKASISLSFVGNVNAQASVNLNGVTAEEAVRMIARSAELSVRSEGTGFVIGSAADVAAAFAPPPLVPVAPGAAVSAVYRCRHINATTLVATLQNSFDPQVLKVALGPSFLSPNLVSGTSAAEITTDQGAAISLLGEGDPNLKTHTVVLTGDPQTVQRALDVARELDVHRPQVRIHVKISDVSTDALKQLGIQWSYGDLVIKELPNVTLLDNTAAVDGLRFGKFVHSPWTVTAVLSALEQEGKAKVLAEPSLFVLDGERSFILIGQRLLFPRLANTYFGGASFDVQESRVGIYLQVAVQIGDEEDDVVLSIYPQVSFVTDFLEVNDSRYPQITTREQQTTIRARHGEMIVIGGLLRDEDIQTMRRIPLLGRIPLFGELFKYRERTSTKSELIMTLVPEIEKTGSPPAAPPPPAQ